MKKNVLIALMFAGVAFSAQAQAPNNRFKYPLSNGQTTAAPPFYTTLDTLTNATSDTFTYQAVGKLNSVTFQLNVKQITGYTGGTFKIYGSADGGFNYCTTPLYTAQLPNANTVLYYVVSPNNIWGNPFTHYRGIVTDSGTQTSSYRCYVLPR